MAACCSRSVQICSKENLSTHNPWHLPHSLSIALPMVIRVSEGCSLHLGQVKTVASPTSRSTRSPHSGQKRAPKKIMPKQDGQATVASRAPQCSQFGASVRVGAPHIGQLRVFASGIYKRIHTKSAKVPDI